MKTGTILLLICLLALSTYGVDNSSAPSPLPGFTSNSFGEQTFTETNALGVRIHINAPSASAMAPHKKVTLVFYALPNGNTIEQTVGKKMKAGEDWHFDIQHIGAQTRYLRKRSTKELIVVAYLENSLKSWPAWRKKNGDQEISAILESVKKRFSAFDTHVVLSGHSGGGSLIFGYLNTVKNIPAEIKRIAFLDANYAYDTALHKAKIVGWLQASPEHRLIVLAYHDSVALLNGKPFVSEAGGTWGKSRQMQTDLKEQFQFTSVKTGELQKHTALDRQIVFLLRENPEKKIWHTVQVERNGFIQAMLIGTEEEGKDYTYLGDRVYEGLIQGE